MLLVLLEPVSRADFKYVCIIWIEGQIWEICEKTSTITRICPRCFLFHFKNSRIIIFWSISRPGKNVDPAI